LLRVSLLRLQPHLAFLCVSALKLPTPAIISSAKY
jgi:hypothetical protein